MRTLKSDLYRHGFYIRWLLISGCARMMQTMSFFEKKIGFDYSFGVTKCLQQIEMSDCVRIKKNEQPSIIRPMRIGDLILWN